MSKEPLPEQNRIFDPRGGPTSPKERWVLDVVVTTLLLIDAVWKALRG